MNTNAEASRLFDELHIEFKRNKVSRRKMSEVLSRIKTWFNKEFYSNEIIPKEFDEFLQAHKHTHQHPTLSYECMKMSYLWSKAL